MASKDVIMSNKRLHSGPVQPSQGGKLARKDLGISAFSDYSLVAYLSQDMRPSFIVHCIPYEDVTLSYCNTALLNHLNLNEKIASIFRPGFPQEELDNESHEFRSWVISGVVKTIGFDGRHSHSFHEALWTATVMGERWVVVSGIELTKIEAVRAQDVQMWEQGTSDMDNSPRDLSVRSSVSDTKSASRTSRDNKRNRIPLGEIWPPSHVPPSDHLTFIRQFDWASNPLGPIEGWSPQLRTALEMALMHPDPVTIFYGEELVMIYNDAYIAIAGNKHPELMGGSARVHWKEVWDQYDSLFNQMRVDGRAFKQEKVQLFINRKGFLEEGFFNLTITPFLGEDGSVVGFYEPVVETTRQVLSERRMHLLLKVSETTASATDLPNLWRLLLSALRTHESDIHFVTLHCLRPGNSGEPSPDRYFFEGAVGFQNGTLPFSPFLDLENPDGTGFAPVFHRARELGDALLLKFDDESLPQHLLELLKSRGLQKPCQEVVVYPLSSGVDDGTSAFLTIGITPTLRYNDDYQLFLQLLARQVESTVTFVKLFEKEKARLKEQAAYESEIRFKRFAERAPVGIFIFDSDGTIKFCNEKWREICGMPAEDISKPMSWIPTVHPDNVEEMKVYWNKVARLEGPQTFEVQYAKPWRPIQGADNSIGLDRTYGVASTYAEVSDDGKLTGILGCVTDISHQKWAERLQAQRLSEALELKRQQENFLDITSHEMRNPLNAILHCASELVELLTGQISKALATDERTSILGECLDAARTIIYCSFHQKRIIDDVLTLSKLDSDLLGISPLPSRPLGIVEEVLKVFDSELRTSKIQTTTHFAESYQREKIDMILIDPHRVIQILINLIANAIKFTKGESLRCLRIVIGASMEEPSIHTGSVRYVSSGRHRKDPTQDPGWGDLDILFLHFSVQDTGPGMSQDEANLLFNRFAQASPRTHAQYGGSGLGLFISRELAELHGGRIGMSSELGLGSTFDFYVKGRRAMEGQTSPSMRKKLAISAAATRQMTDIRKPSGSSSAPSVLLQARPRPKIHVLIVEDNLINQNILRKLMQKHGYEVSIANHGEEALAMIQASTCVAGKEGSGAKLDIVLMDVEMPIMDGKTCVRKIRELQREGMLNHNIPVIAVTGNARSEQITIAKESGFDDVVSKPYRVDDLISRIRHYVGHYDSWDLGSSGA